MTWRLRVFAAAGPVLVIACLFHLWLAPSEGDGHVLLNVAVLLAFEFILVIAGFAMVTAADRTVILVLAVGILPFALVMLAMAPTSGVLVAYLAMVVGRFIAARGDPDRLTRMRAICTGVAAVALYVLSMMIVPEFENHIPRLGLTESYLASEPAFSDRTASGLLVDQPHITLAIGIVYFSGLALLALFPPRWRFVASIFDL